MSKEVRVGFVFFLGLALLLVFTIIIGRGELRLHRGYYTVDVLFEHVRGLRRNDVVELAGMEIGRVDSIRMEEDMIRVSLRIDEAYSIRKDAEITIGERSLIGGKVVFVGWGEEKDFLQPGAVVAGEAAPTPVDVIKQISGLGEGLEEKLGEAGELIPELKSLLESLNQISSAIERGEGTIGKLVKEDDVYYDLSDTLKSARTVTTELSDFAEGLGRIRTYIGADAAHNFDTSHTLWGVYLRIEPRPEKLYKIGGKALIGSGTSWSERDDHSLELDFQIGWRFLEERLTGRVGVFESRAGAGLDYRFNERFSATVEGRDVWTGRKDEGIRPFLLRGRLNYRLFRGVYLHAGADNILDNPGFNAGLRLEYGDEDIKHLVGVAGVTR